VGSRQQNLLRRFRLLTVAGESAYPNESRKTELHKRKLRQKPAYNAPTLSPLTFFGILRRFLRFLSFIPAQLRQAFVFAHKLTARHCVYSPFASFNCFVMSASLNACWCIWLIDTITFFHLYETHNTADKVYMRFALHG
jgi:hypothetical protein